MKVQQIFLSLCGFGKGAFVYLLINNVYIAKIYIITILILSLLTVLDF
jgi:hypothetical protein